MSLLKSASVSLERASKRLVDKVSIELEAGELLGLIGPNGAGKSTLLSLLAGLEPCSAGVVSLGQRDIKSIDVAELARFKLDTHFIYETFGSTLKGD